jgi:hypothetical protein
MRITNLLALTVDCLQVFINFNHGIEDVKAIHDPSKFLFQFISASVHRNAYVPDCPKELACRGIPFQGRNIICLFEGNI